MTLIWSLWLHYINIFAYQSAEMLHNRSILSSTSLVWWFWTIIFLRNLCCLHSQHACRCIGRCTPYVAWKYFEIKNQHFDKRIYFYPHIFSTVCVSMFLCFFLYILFILKTCDTAQIIEQTTDYKLNSFLFCIQSCI